MPMRNPDLTAGQDAFNALKLKSLRALIRAGVDALDRGDFVEIDDANLDRYVEQLACQPNKKPR